MNLMHLAPNFIEAYTTDNLSSVEVLLNKPLKYECAEAFVELVISNNKVLKENSSILVTYVNNPELFNKSKLEEFRR